MPNQRWGLSGKSTEALAVDLTRVLEQAYEVSMECLN